MFWQFEVWQLIVQVFCVTLHELHCDGHPVLASPVRGASMARAPSIWEPATTQNPPLHTRPPSHSLLSSHA